MFLNCIICQVNMGSKVMYGKGIGCSTYVALVVPISSQNPMKLSQKHIMTEVKFTFIIQQRTIQIKLHDPCCRSCLFMLLALLYDIVQFVNLVYYLDAFSLVTVLTWFYNPYISALLLVFAYLLSSFLETCNKFPIFWISKAMPYMKGQRYSSEKILAHNMTILPHIIKESFLIPEVKIILKMVVQNGLYGVVTNRFFHSSISRPKGFTFIIYLFAAIGIKTLILIVFFHVEFKNKRLKEISIALAPNLPMVAIIFEDFLSFSFIQQFMSFLMLQFWEVHHFSKTQLFLGRLLLCGLLTLKNPIYLDLSPYKQAFISQLLGNSPPKSPFNKSLDHVGVIAWSDISQEFFYGLRRKDQIQGRLNAVSKLKFPKKLHITFNPFFVNLIAFSLHLLPAVGHFFIKIDFVLSSGGGYFFSRWISFSTQALCFFVYKR